MQTAVFLFFYHLQALHPFIPLAVSFFAQYVPYILIAGLFLYLFFLPSLPFWKRFSILLGAAASSGIGYLIALLIRSLYPISRPFALLPDINPLVDASDTALTSFPSLHATIFFALGTFLFFYHKRLGALYLFAALLIALSRVIAGIHWPLDILAGAVLGILGAFVVRRLALSIKRYL